MRWLLGVVLLVSLLLVAATRVVKRWKRSMDVGDDTEYAANLATCEQTIDTGRPAERFGTGMLKARLRTRNERFQYGKWLPHARLWA